MQYTNIHHISLSVESFSGPAAQKLFLMFLSFMSCPPHWILKILPSPSHKRVQLGLALILELHVPLMTTWSTATNNCLLILFEFILWDLPWPKYQTNSALLRTNSGAYWFLTFMQGEEMKSYFHMGYLRVVKLWELCRFFPLLINIV